MAKKGTQEWWYSQIKKGLEWRKKNGHEERWPDIQKYYQQDLDNPLLPNFNLIYMLGSSLLPSLVYQNPHIMNSARRPEFNQWASFFDAIDNWLIDEMEVKSVCEDAVLQAFLFNVAAIKIGYDFPENQQFTGDEMRFPRVEGLSDRSRKVNQPFIDLVTPERLVFAPGTRSMKNCKWYAIFYLLPTKVLKERHGVRNVKTTNVPKEVQKTSEKHLTDEEATQGYTGFWEVHDMEKGEWFFLDTNQAFIMGPEKDPLQVDGAPLEVLVFNKSSDSIWGTPDSLYIETQYLEGNEIRRMGRLQRRIALVKALYKKGALSEESIEKFLTGDPMAFIEVDDISPDTDINKIISLVQPHVQLEYGQEKKDLLNDAQLLSGTGPNQFGTFAPGRRTKYETQVVEERNLLRTGARRERVADAIGRIFSRVNQLIVKYWTAPIVAKVVGVNGAIYWVRAKPAEFSDLKAQLVTKVNVESLAPTSRERKRQEMMDVLTLLSKFEGANPLPILQNFLGTFDWMDVSTSLPMGNNAPVGIGEFQNQQQGMLQNPAALMQQAQQNLGGMNRAITALPARSEGGNAG